MQTPFERSFPEGDVIPPSRKYSGRGHPIYQSRGRFSFRINDRTSRCNLEESRSDGARPRDIQSRGVAVLAPDA
jgi:hypothetical protein